MTPFYSIGSRDFWLDVASASSNGGSTDDMIFISKQTASSASSLEFTSGIDSTYPIYKIFATDIITSATSGPQLGYQASTDGGASYGISATTTNFDLLSNATSGQHAVQQTSECFHSSTALQTIGIGTDTTGHAGFEMTFYSPSLTSANYKLFDVIATVCNDGVSYIRRFMTTTMFNAGTNDIDALKFSTASGTFSGTFLLYGIKDS